MQKILQGYQQIGNILEELNNPHYMLVCGSSYYTLPIKDMLKPDLVFSDFSPNPRYEDVCKGVKAFNENHCEAIVAIGGGSAMDVAKCIKLFCKMDPEQSYLQKEYKDSGIPLIAVPTTAGSGSESTRYAVIYHNGTKHSIAHNSIIPDYAILDSSLLKTLPLYQKKCTMLDALCQGIESLWSVNSTEKSMIYSKIAIQMIMEHWHEYIELDNDEGAYYIMMASNYAGQAINITQTTAAHAMSYKLTSLYGIPHGHAVALSMTRVWMYLLEHPEKCVDPRGEDHLSFILEWLGQMMLCDTPYKGLMMFNSILVALDMQYPHSDNREADIDLLTESVNLERLGNTPVKLDKEAIRFMYERIIS